MTDDKKQGKKLVLAAGVICIALALLANVLGLGSSPVFGWKQIALLVVGIGLVVWSAKGCCGCSPKKS